jgi:CHAT domain-containing protein
MPGGLSAEMVVLSACNTGGEVSYLSDKEVPGLLEGWLESGTKSLVLSLWSVADMPTLELMMSFYRKLQHGVGKAQALRQAMLSTRSDFDDPRQWAAFIIIGAD